MHFKHWFYCMTVDFAVYNYCSVPSYQQHLL